MSGPGRYAAGQAPLYALCGTVVRARGIGKLVGMPTADLEPAAGNILPPVGVYVAQAVLGGAGYAAVTNIGPRPTVDSDPHSTIETHILDFDREIYGQRLELRLFVRLRGPQRFEDLSRLLEQVRSDCAAARAFWGLEAPGLPPCMDARTRRVRLGRQEIYLSEKEFDLLYLLYVNQNDVFTKEQLYEAVWGQPSNGCCHAVENTVFQVRKKLRPYGGAGLIQTVAGRGYRFGPSGRTPAASP